MAFPLRKKIIVAGCKWHKNKWGKEAVDYKTMGMWWKELYYDKKKIFAPWGGKVNVVWGPIGGWWIKLTRVMGDRLEFAHCTKAYVKNGINVRQGQLIGLSGKTGSFNGKDIYGHTLTPSGRPSKPYLPHLHLQIIRAGKRVCPEGYNFGK